MADSRSSALLRRGNLAPLVLVNLGVFVHATIWYMAGTAMPSVVKDLGATAYISWATSIYLVASILGGAAMALVGTGFGACNAFLNQRVMAAAQPGQEDATAGAIPTLGGLGAAVSAALAGLVGNAVGLGGALTPQTVSTATLALFGGGALVAAPAVWLAWRLLRALERDPHDLR